MDSLNFGSARKGQKNRKNNQTCIDARYCRKPKGDVDYLSRQYVERNEKLGIGDMLSQTILEKEFLSLWKEYEKKKSIEAKIVKDADNLDVDMELREHEFRGHKIVDGWREHREKVVKGRFYTQTAKDLWDSIQASNPHDWHYKGRNRFNGGDWKE